MRDDASEYKPEEMMQFLESKGIQSNFSSPKATMQKWCSRIPQAEASADATWDYARAGVLSREP